MWLAKEKFPQFEKITFLDITKNKEYGIIGGVVNGQPTISLFDFNTSMTLVGHVTIPCEQEYAQDGITGLRVSSQIDRLFLCSTRNSLYMVQFDASNKLKVQLAIVK
jgi:hypothetical protein